jgi:hypothetical protein
MKFGGGQNKLGGIQMCNYKDCKEPVFTFWSPYGDVETPFCSEHGIIDILDHKEKKKK